MNKTLQILILLLLFCTSASYLYAGSMSAKYLCEYGLKLYKEGNTEDALHELRKALIAQPDYEPALRYIQMIEQSELQAREEMAVIPPVKSSEISFPPVTSAVESLELYEIQSELIKEKQARVTTKPYLSYSDLSVKKSAETVTPQVLVLDQSLAANPKAIEIEQGKSIVLTGRNISRFLVTQPDILDARKLNENELIVTGKQIGYSYVYIWDDNGRFETEFLGIFPKLEGPTYEELMRKEEDRGRNFILRYYLDWISYYTGPDAKTLGRTNYSWSHALSLDGDTPYGRFNSALNIRSLSTSTDLTYLTLGLTEGKLGPFKGFTLRGFDNSPPFSNLIFPGATIRGVSLTSPAFNKALEYTAFWGKESGGRYGNLSPGLAEPRSAYLTGANLSFSPDKVQNYRLTYVQGYGKDRDPELKKYGYDLSGRWNFNNWGLGYELANDSDKYAQLFNMRYQQEKLNFSAELRDIDKQFFSITSRGWRQGELGSLFRLTYTPTEKLNISSNLDVFRDRLFPAEDNPKRWNQDFDFTTAYQVDPDTSVNVNYTLQNELGRAGQFRYSSPGAGLSKTFHLFNKNLYTYLNYWHQDNKNYSSPSSDFINEKLYGGLRLNLIGELYYYASRECNWVQEEYFGTKATPNVWETGFDWTSQIFKTPFFGTFRFGYRNEEDAVSNLTFLSGEDYIEGYSELSYRPNEDTEFYGSCRMRNVWADSPNTTNHFDMDFSAGMRYVWDTGLHWDAIGNIEGYVFKDLNSDGLRQRDEPPVEGIKIWIGKRKSQVTDLFGYYKFKGMRGSKFYVNLDTSTMPGGFVLTVPVTQGVFINNNGTTRIDFGIISRSEISGVIFEDTDDNGSYSNKDKGVAGVSITLDNDLKKTTGSDGRYSFENVTSGKHILRMELDTLPVSYLPKTAIIKEIELFEGIAYNYNIPLKTVKEE